MTMIEKLLPAAALLLSTMVQPATAQTTPRSTATSTSDTVLVAPPTGERAADRASIEAALGAVQPGGTVQFAPGTYLVGEFIRVSVPRVTLQGHVDGTTLRGCEPERFDLPDGFGMEEVGVVSMGCTGLYLIADRQTVRGLTLEHAWQALWIGCCLDPAEEGEAVEPSHVGGHLIEGNTFRASVNGFRVIGDSPEPVVIRDNDFVNVWHAGAVNGRTAHILGNRISVPDAAQVPPNGFPGLALFITPYDTRADRAFTCAGNVIAGNRVEGHPEDIAILALRAGAICRDNVIRENTIRVDRVGFTGTPWGVTGIGDPADSTLTGVPIALSDLSAQAAEIFGLPAEPGDEVLIQDNLIEGNRIVGGEGLGIEVLRASGNRIVDNTITGIVVRDPFPGNTMYVPPPWGEANGSGIWISPGSDGNAIVGNTFENVAGAAVFVESDDNRVELRSPTDSVHDLGTDNEVSVADGAEGSDVATAERIAAAADTVHVAPPTGDRETDRSNVLAALEEVQPGGTILFAQGTYLIGGEIIRVTVPRITLLGHPEGTTLRGCDPGEFPWDDLTEFGNNCNAIELAAGQQTVRNLTFEHAMWALHVGCCWDGRPGFEAGDGGHLIEGNTFRNSSNGVRVHGFWTEPTVIRNNRFLNNWHSVAIYGNTVHLLDNDISAPEPEKVQLLGFPGDAIHIGPPATLHESVQGGMRSCENNVVAGNRIDGTTEGIMVMADDETPCRNNVIRDNTIGIRRARPAAIPGFIRVHDDTDETVVGVPLALRGAVVDNLIEGNVINGAEGLGIEIRNASRNRIVSNTVTRVLRREPFPGNAIVALPILGGDPNAWRAANGSGIWVSPGSAGNEIVGNTFEEVEAAVVFLEGDSSRVELRSAGDSVRDLGTGNEVTATDAAVPPAGQQEMPRAAGESDSLPRARPNDHRTTAGRRVGGEFRVELVAVEAEWYPRGPDGPRIVTPAFAEEAGPPSVPGPLIRASAGTSIHVVIRNTLDQPIAVRGLVDRSSPASNAPPEGGPLPAFTSAEPLVVPPGETRETRFTPTAAVSSFYYAQTLPPGAGAETARPLSRLEEGAFLGALVVDPAENGPPLHERVLMITRWGSLDEPGMGISWKMMMNGRSWPYTERLEYTVGDSARWRVINASVVDHPMHLHGFFFRVDAVGDTQADTSYAGGARPQVVTQLMEEFSSLRLTWVPEEPGNWLFHCHLVRHMGPVQQFAVERNPAAADRELGTMAGLVTGITVRPTPGGEPVEEPPARRIHLWTGERPEVYNGEPELAFVVQEGAEPPPPDSTRVPGSPLVLTRGEPTEIVVHNRLDFPLSVHWHGLELESRYDGVGSWSGRPGATRPPIAPGDSVRVHIRPPRAGTFIYHTHGEPGHELSQGLYGPFLVMPEGQPWDRDRDRVFLLAARGAERDAAPAINGRTWPDPERFQPGRSYRLRFINMSPDAFKRVRLLRDGEPDRWRPLAKDGADLPQGSRGPREAELGIGVGETYDVVWTPESSGVAVLEVTTEFYPATGGSVTQRVAFGVGDVPDEELALARDPGLPIVPLSDQERERYVGTFVGDPPGDDPPPIELVIRVREEGNELYTTGIQVRGREDADYPFQLFPLGDHTFAAGRDLEGLIHSREERYRFVPDGGDLNRLNVEVGPGLVIALERVQEAEP